MRDGSIFGYEALSRGPENTEMHSPVVLFEHAETYDKLWELEVLCRTKAFENYNKCNSQQFASSNDIIKLFLNVDPNIMNDSEYRKGFTREHISKFSLNAENVIFEITEREAINNLCGFKEIVQNYKEQDYMIAIDDAGAGYSGLNLISDIHPHFIKLDMNLIRDVDTDFTKQSLIKSMCDFANQTNINLIAEGIEKESELVKLIEIGVHYGQGYLIQKPNELILPIKDEVLDMIYEANSKKNHITNNKISDIYIGNISTKFGTINSNMCIADVINIVDEDSSIPGFCITDSDNLVGVITRNELYSNLSGPFGYSLNSNKPIINIMSKDFLSVDYKTPIDTVAKHAMKREYSKLYDFITITKDEKYYGIVTVKDLLEKSIQIEVHNAKHINPLSELPGNLLIEMNLEECIHTQENYCVLYFDINNFKSYNDVYGFEKGDVVLKKLTAILKRNIPQHEFIGHIGGDDFIAILLSSEPEELCNNIINDFTESVYKFYNINDFNRGYIISSNRRGIKESFPLLSISIAGLRNNSYKDIFDLSEKASHVKSMCKQRGGSNYIIL